jgi:hypothetical protein
VDSICVQGRLITDTDINVIRSLRVEHPEWSRRQLSDHLVERWQWYNEAGRPKDMAARSLLLKLQVRGLIDLPTPLKGNGNRQRGARPPRLTQPELLSWQPERIAAPLWALQPLRLECVEGLPQRRRAASLLEQHHYLGFSGAVGENVQYLVRDAHERELAVMVFGAAAWKVAGRDQFIGWSVAQRRQGLSRITNQQRFLILPWVRVPHLASHALALAIQRVSEDWQKRYGHAVWLVETFVEEDRFAGTAYQAAGWLRVGQTTGRTRQDRDRTHQVPIKSVWVKPLHPRFREQLCRL